MSDPMTEKLDAMVATGDVAGLREVIGQLRDELGPRCVTFLPGEILPAIREALLNTEAQWTTLPTGKAGKSESLVPMRDGRRAHVTVTVEVVADA